MTQLRRPFYRTIHPARCLRGSSRLSDFGLLLSSAPAFPLIAIALWLTTPLAYSERVTVEYEAEASTVVDQPFGMVVPRLTVVRGHFTYESDTPDLKPEDPMRGSFLLSGTWDFRAEFLDQVITGSGTATSTTNLFGSPTLSFEDGTTTDAAGIMSRNGVPEVGIGLNFRISGASKDLPTDQLPIKFSFDPPPLGASHTFVLSDGSGRMLLQFRWFRQVGLAIKSIKRTGDVVELVWSSSQGKRHALEFSTDLRNWAIIRDDLIGNPQATAVSDDLAQRYSSGPLPPMGFYRIVDGTPPPDNP